MGGAGAHWGSGDARASASPADGASKIQFAHIVQIHAGRYPHATPLFICAGMFGNILNRRHLAIQIGQDRPVYGLQARGLYGGQAPHETFEEMAASYLEEVRVVQPRGPYLLSGFSGGGLVAYEMAQQLIAAGETVDMVVMLDTPFPEGLELSRLDRLYIRYQEFRQQGGAFFHRWLYDRISFELKRRQKERADGSGSGRFPTAARRFFCVRNCGPRSIFAMGDRSTRIVVSSNPTMAGHLTSRPFRSRKFRAITTT